MTGRHGRACHGGLALSAPVPLPSLVVLAEPEEVRCAAHASERAIPCLAAGGATDPLREQRRGRRLKPRPALGAAMSRKAAVAHPSELLPATATRPSRGSNRVGHDPAASRRPRGGSSGSRSRREVDPIWSAAEGTAPSDGHSKRGSITSPKSGRPVSGDTNGNAPTREDVWSSMTEAPPRRRTLASTPKSRKMPRLASRRPTARASAATEGSRPCPPSHASASTQTSDESGAR